MTEIQKRVIKKWSAKEESLLLEQIKEDKEDSEIATLHERSEGAIILRRRKIALEMFKDGNPLDQIFKITRVSEDEIEHQKKYNEKKNQDDTKKLSVIKKKLQEIIDLM